MRGPTLGFSCSGVYEEKIQEGFAAPVRDITTFLPPKWQDSAPHLVQLRYRKKGSGAVILKVCATDHGASVADIMIEITVAPLSSLEPKDALVVALSDYLNLDSWNRASLQDQSVAPALHYKRLAELMSQFAKTFDLGMDEEVNNKQYTDSSVVDYRSLPSSSNPTWSRDRCDPLRIEEPWRRSGGPTIGSAFPGLVDGGNRGHFAGDLTPGGIRGPGLPGMDPSQGGSLMGPNHPAFHGGLPPGSSGGGLGMQPRFDPLGPPPTRPEGDDPSNLPARRRNGEPNPDHMRPPNNLSNNMFL